MPSSGIITLQFPLSNRVAPKWMCPFSHGRNLVKVVYAEKNKPSSKWKTGSGVSRQWGYRSGHLAIPGSAVIKVVATAMSMEKTLPIVQREEEGGHSSNLDRGLESESNPVSVEEMAEVDCRERKRRLRISKANTGKVPWNKGKKHSPETIARIRERTKQAMQNPKIREKLINCAHPQSEETRAKIGMAVRRGYKQRREKLLLQETCFLQWEESIAEAARRGDDGENELGWNDYEILKAKLHQEWLEAIAIMKAKEEEKRGYKRGAKSADHRKKISEAIRAKWADPDYQQRVRLGMQKFHGTRPSSARRRAARKPIVTVGDKSIAPETMGKKRKYLKVLSSYKKKSPAPYVDPLIGAKLEMIKQLRANRASMEAKKREATERARLLIAEAEKAAKALETAAVRDATAQASLFETRKLLAEAVRSMRSVESTAATSVLQKRPTTCVDAEALQSDPYNSHMTASAIPGLGDGNGMCQSSMCNNGKFSSEYDAYNSTVEDSLNGRLTRNISQNAYEQRHPMEIGATNFLNYVNSVLVNGKPTAEDTIVKLKSRHDEKIGKETVLSSEANSGDPSMEVSHATMAYKPTKEETARKLEANSLQNIRKDIMLPVEVNSIDYECFTQNIAGKSERRHIQMGNDGILSSEKNVKKIWVCGRLIGAKDN